MSRQIIFFFFAMFSICSLQAMDPNALDNGAAAERGSPAAESDERASAEEESAALAARRSRLTVRRRQSSDKVPAYVASLPERRPKKLPGASGEPLRRRGALAVAANFKAGTQAKPLPSDS